MVPSSLAHLYLLPYPLLFSLHLYCSLLILLPPPLHWFPFTGPLSLDTPPLHLSPIGAPSLPVLASLLPSLLIPLVTSSEPRHTLRDIGVTTSQHGRLSNDVGDTSSQLDCPLRDIGDTSFQSRQPFREVGDTSSQPRHTLCDMGEQRLSPHACSTPSLRCLLSQDALWATSATHLLTLATRHG